MNERFARANLRARVDLAHEPDFALGRAQIRPTRREIVGEVSRETVEPRVMRALVALARAKGEILSRDDLIESCWDSVVVGEEAINRCMGRLRKAAAASGDAFLIETVPRVGYRLKTTGIATSAPDGEGSARPEPEPSALAPPPPPAPSSWRSRAPVRSAIAIVVVLTLVVAGFGWWRLRPETMKMPVGPAASVAVLPFVNLSGNPAKEYFSDGFSEELLNDLSNDSRLRVAARTSAFAFKGRNEDVEAIAQALRVRAVVEGSVREAGDRVRITAQLINAGNGYSIWSASYDRNLADILSVQNEVARAVAVALTHKIIPARPSAARPGTIAPAVYRLFLQGRWQLDLISPDGYARAYGLLKQVTAREPHFADGLAAFSRAAWGYSGIDSLHADAIAAEAKDAAAKALLLDPRNIEAREMRGLFKLDEWDWSGASADFDILRTQNPNHMRVLAGLHLYYENMGFPDEAVETMRRAEALDPLSDTPKSLMLQDLRALNRYDEEIGMARGILAHRPDDDFALYTLCNGLAWSGRTQRAREAAKRLYQVKNTGAQNCEYGIDVNAGDIPAARKIVESWIAGFPDTFPEARTIASGYVGLNDFDKASDWYERAYERHENIFTVAYSVDAVKYRVTARWKALTQKPRFKAWQAEHDRISAELAARGGAP